MSAVGMPAHLLCFFKSRPPMEYFQPPKKRKMPDYDGISEYVHFFESTRPPPVLPYESPKERKLRLKVEKIRRHESELQEKKLDYQPNKPPAAGGDLTADPLRTLFVGRLSYELTDKKLKKEFEQYGTIRKTRVIYDFNGKPRGYGFIEFENQRDLKESYKEADGRKIEGWRIIVDIERGRTVYGWLPRRLGGGRGVPRGNSGRTLMLNPWSRELQPRESIKESSRDPTGKEASNRDIGRNGRDSTYYNRDTGRPRDVGRRRSRSRERRRSRSYERESRRKNRSRSHDRARFRDRRR